MGQLPYEVGGVGQIHSPRDALGDIWARNARLDTYSDSNTVASLEQAIEAIDDVVRMLDGCPAPQTQSSVRGHLECSVCHLGKIAIYDPECESAYLIHEGRLLEIDTFRIAREHNHWRIKLVGSDIQLPVQGLARVVVSDNNSLTGMTLEEVRHGS